MSENITRSDLKTILIFGIHLARLEDDQLNGKKPVLRQIADAVHLTPEERRELTQDEISLGRSLRRLSCPGAKLLMLKTLCLVSQSSGEASPPEVEFIHNVVDLLGEEVFLLPKKEWGSYETEVMEALDNIG